MEYERIYEANKEKFSELQEECRWAANKWQDECWANQLWFVVTEAYRPQWRQEELYKIGRRGIKGEAPVTWTRSSNHTQRRAVDIMPLPEGYGDIKAYAAIENIAAVYGIAHPLPNDKPHFEFFNVMQPFPPLSVLLQQTVNRMRTAKDALLRMLTRKKKRIEKRLDEGED